ncbi:MAG: alpha/beta hydrolase [Pirellulales bacterium]|nr:alpha/beta hydrolase [Pirellulales bacterium]
MSCTSRSLPLLALLVPVLFGGMVMSPAQAQQSREPEVEEVDLVSKDGVLIKANYYHGTEDEDTVPVIVVHGEGGQRSELDGLAKALQKEGHAVLVPDLRGHGDSTRVQGRPDIKLDHEKMRPVEFSAAINDIEACKKFFIKVNNEQKVNIENLCLVGSGPLGSVLSFSYAGEDWLFRPFGRFKQGQDVKAVIMFSPVMRDKTIQAAGYMDDLSVMQEISYFMVVNNNSTSASRDATRFEDALNRASRVKADEKRIIRLDVPTTLEGASILEVKESEEILRQVNAFIKLRVVDKNHEWKKRERTGSSPIPFSQDK